MGKIFNNLKSFITYLDIYKSNFKNFGRYKDRIAINSIATGTIIPVEKHTSFQVKHHMMNAKYNILLSEGSVYVPFDCEVVEVSSDLSTVILKTKEPYLYAIYIDKCSKFLTNDFDCAIPQKDHVLFEYQKIFNVDLEAAYANGHLPIVSFCILQDFEYTKVFYGKTKACSNTSILFY